MPSAAEQVAISLTQQLIATGSLGAAAPALEHSAPEHPAAAAKATLEAVKPFAGLKVQAVGVTKGRPADEKSGATATDRERARVESEAKEKIIVYVEGHVGHALPDRIKGVPVEVHPVAPLRAGPALEGTTGNFYVRNGRTACGSSVAPKGVGYAGTVGALLEQGTRILALSNNHVFADCNRFAAGHSILAPAAVDAKTGRPAPTEIARLAERVELLRPIGSTQSPVMMLDAATAEVSDPATVSSWQGDAATGYDTPRGALPPFHKLQVKKFGRSSGLTFGEMGTMVPAKIPIPYNGTFFKTDLWFENIWTIHALPGRRFAERGDSGALVVSDDGGGAVGLLFAATEDGKLGYMCNLQDILRTFGFATLLKGHGV